MKTHELAGALSQLAKLLRSAPDVELTNLRDVLVGDSSGKLAVNLSTLAELSRVDRRQWLTLINEYKFPIEVRPRDASRDILGKLLKYLELNIEARERLKSSWQNREHQASPELLRALDVLLKEKY